MIRCAECNFPVRDEGIGPDGITIWKHNGRGYIHTIEESQARQNCSRYCMDIIEVIDDGGPGRIAEQLVLFRK